MEWFCKVISMNMCIFMLLLLLVSHSHKYQNSLLVRKVSERKRERESKSRGQQSYCHYFVELYYIKNILLFSLKLADARENKKKDKRISLYI